MTVNKPPSNSEKFKYQLEIYMYKLINLQNTFFITSLSVFEKNNQVNILWIFSNDHAYQAIDTYGGRFESLNLTPNLTASSRPI
ncbi:MAG: hypothetical protein H8E32_00640 [Nitrospinae bacterium]|nr:hypothetical protein [Nitrospinota bacterium]